jgi:uncharacterized protein YecT (DUF1311 family)
MIMARMLSVILALAFGGAVQQGGAQSLNTTALEQIMDTARALCGEFAREGFRSSSAIEGTARAELAGLAGRLFDLGVEGAGQLDSSEYANVLQEQLGEELQNQRECNLKIWNDLRTLVMTPAPQGAVDVPPGELFGSRPASPLSLNHYATRSPVRAGFDCAKATTPPERLICSDASLASADLYLNNEYRSLLDEAKRAGFDYELRRAQTSWIAFRDSVCPVTQDTLVSETWRAEAISCLIRETEQRASLLASGRF